MTTEITVRLPKGDAVIPTLWDHAVSPVCAVALAHGAGAGPEHPFLAGFAAALSAESVTVMRFAFPYRAAGRRMPGPAAHATETWRAVLPALASAVPGVPLVAAGKSYGGRMASMAAAEGVISPQQLVYLGYPLHPPGRADQPRTAHLPQISAPQLFVSGTRDPFVDPVIDLERAVASCVDARLEWIEGGGHSFEVAGQRREPDEIGAALARRIRLLLPVA